MEPSLLKFQDAPAPSKLYRRFVGLSIFILMLCPFVFSHAVYLSRPLLRFSLILIPLIVSFVAATQNLRPFSRSQVVLLVLVGLNVLWEFASCFWAISYSAAVRDMSAFLILFLLTLALIVLRQSVSTEHFRKCLLRAVSALLILVLLHTGIDIWNFKETTLSKFNVPLTSSTLYALKTCFYHKNSVSTFVLLSLVIIYATSNEFSKRTRRPYLLMTAVGVMLIMFFQSRSVQLALLLFFAGVVLAHFFQSRKGVSQKRIFSVFLFGLLCVLIVGSGRLRHSSWHSRSSQERVQLWKNTIELIKERPIIGHGIGNWAMVFPKTGLKDFVRIQEKGRNFFIQPHSDYLKVWSETGGVGLLLFLSIPLYLLYLCIRRRQESTILYFLALLSFYIVSLVTGRKGELHLYVLLAALLVESFSFVSGRQKQGSSLKLPLLLLLVVSPISIYALRASYFDWRQIENIQTLQQIGNGYNRAAIDKNLSECFHPLASTTRMTKPIKAHYAQVLTKIGYQEDALALYEEAFADSPFHLATKFRAAKLSISCGRKTRAKELLEEILTYNPDHKPSIELLRKLEE